MSENTLGSKLIALKDRSGLSLDNIAKAAGYSRASSIQRYFSPDYDVKWLPRALADRLTEALVGFGDPAVERSDIEYLTEYGFMMDRRSPMPLHPHMFQRRIRDDLECNSTYPTRLYISEAELFDIAADPIQVFQRPEHLSRRPIEAIYISTLSMSPRYRPGELVIYERERPATPGQDVIVTTRSGDQSESEREEAFAAIFVGRTKTDAAFSILEPASTFSVPLSEISEIHPILSTSDLLSPKYTHGT